MPKTVMVVDDSASIRQLVAMTLQGAGFSTIEAGDGEEALSKLDGKAIDLIVSDVNMPKLDGIGLLKAVRSNPSYKFTPVMMLTTESQESKKNEGKAAGARAWLVKPFKPDALLTAVSRLT